MSAPRLQPAQRRGLAGEAADRVREAIFAGVFPPGTPLKEVELAASLQVSRGSVREGLTMLEREGLVVSEWHKGTWVRSLSRKDVEELYTLRLALDVLAMRTAAANATPESLANLDAAVADMATTRDATELVTLDMRFHDGVYAAAGHQRLTEAWEAIRGQIYLFLLTRIQGDTCYSKIVGPEHAALLQTIRDKDPERAARLAEEHLRGSYEKLMAPVETQ
jgi:DNA-binding GntR family transcriptional regulator